MAKQHRLISELAAIEQQLSQMMRGPHVFTVEQPNATWSPAVDIYETPTGFVLTAEIPGVKSSEVDIKVVNGNLILRGERRWTGENHGEHYHRLESSYGKFERSFTLSEGIDAENITAEMDQGVLKVTLPKRGERSGKTIEIKTD